VPRGDIGAAPVAIARRPPIARTASIVRLTEIRCGCRRAFRFSPL